MRLPLNLRHSPVAAQHLRNPLSGIQNELERMAQDFYGMIDPTHLPAENYDSLRLAPFIDIIDSKEAFKVEAEMPGLDEKDIKVLIGDGMLTIRGEKKTSTQDKGKNYMVREIGYGSYERTIALPDSADLKQAHASFEKGMLWVEIPKKTEATQQYRELKVEKPTKH